MESNAISGNPIQSYAIFCNLQQSHGISSNPVQSLVHPMQSYVISNAIAMLISKNFRAILNNKLVEYNYFFPR